MDNKVFDTQNSFKYLRICVILAVISIFLPSEGIWGSIGAILNIVTLVLTLVAASKLKGLNLYFKKFWIYTLYSLIPAVVMIFIAIFILGSIAGVSGIMNGTGALGLGMFYMFIFFAVMIATIVFEVYAAKNFTEGVKELIYSSRSSEFGNIVEMADEYYKRVKIVIIAIPLMSLLMGMIPVVNIIWAIAITIYGLYHQYKTYQYYKECEDSTPRFFDGENFFRDEFETEEHFWEE